MNMSSASKTYKKHAGHPQKASAQSPMARFLAITRNSLKGTACSIGVALLFLLLCTSLIIRSKDPVFWLLPIALTALYFTALMSGVLTMRFSHDTPWLCGLTSGCMLLLACMLFGCFVPASSVSSAPSALLTRIPIPFLSSLGAALAVKRPYRSTHRKR